MKWDTFSDTGKRRFRSAQEEWKAADRVVRSGRGQPLAGWDMSFVSAECRRVRPEFRDPLAIRADRIRKDGGRSPVEWKQTLRIRRSDAQ